MKITSKRRTKKKEKKRSYKKQKGGNNLKVALVFSGQPRNVSGPSYESIKSNLLDKCNCDIYAHFWLSNSKGKNSPNNGLTNINKINKNIEDFKRLYNPINIQIEEPLVKNKIIGEKYNRFKNDEKGYTSIFRSISMMISNKRGFALVKDVHTYDFVIHIRTDLYINTMPDINTLSKENIYSPMRDNKIKYLDILNIFPSKYAHYYFNGIDIFDLLYNKYSNNNIMWNEDLFYYLLLEYNILQNCIDIPEEKFNVRFVRDNGIKINHLDYVP